jgi:UDP:flavonoid glycosyltransferase YjiC (YdhE family)
MAGRLGRLPLVAIAKAFEAGIEATLAAQAGKPIDGRKLAETHVKQAVAEILEQPHWRNQRRNACKADRK